MTKLLFAPRFSCMDGTRMASHVEHMRQDSARMQILRDRAERMLASPTVTVTARHLRAPSGDIHDYASMGPYWWPDPDRADGLPYIRRDGERNPESQDTMTFSAVFDAVEVLSLAACYLGEERYAADAVRRIRAFFLDPETRCHPHLRYAQRIPGICDGRGIGIIDTHQSFRFFAGVALLDAMGQLPEEVKTGLTTWYDAFTDWMLTSENGRDEYRQHNNHGTWYDEQVAQAAHFLGRKNLLEGTVLFAYDLRTQKHIDAEGKQPFELARTKAMSYSCMNLLALMLLADMAERSGSKRDHWHTVREDGSCALRAALEYLLPFATDLTDFPYRQIGSESHTDSVAHLLLLADRHYPDAGYGARAMELLPQKDLFCLWPW